LHISSYATDRISYFVSSQRQGNGAEFWWGKRSVGIPRRKSENNSKIGLRVVVVRTGGKWSCLCIGFNMSSVEASSSETSVLVS